MMPAKDIALRRATGRAAVARYNARHPDRVRASRKKSREDWKQRDPSGYAKYRRVMDLKRKGLTLESFQLLMEKQSCRCAICGSPFDDVTAPHIDHDHTCCPQNSACPMCIRGLLCHHCNMGLGRFRDSPALLITAASYLERFKR